MKKLLSILVCLAMIMGLAASAFAAADTELAPGAGGGNTSDSVAGGDNAETPNETPTVEMFTLTVNGKDLTIPMANVAIDMELTSVGDYGLIIYTPAYNGKAVPDKFNGYGEAIVVKDGKVVRAFDGMNGKYFDAEHPWPGVADATLCTAANYACEAFASRQEGEYVVIAPHSSAANTMVNGSGTRNFLNSNGRNPGTVVTGLPEVKDENSGSMEVKVTDTYNFIDEYTFTAPVSGTYTFAVPAGLAWMSKTQQELGWDGSPEIDFYSESANPTVVVDLAANENYVFFVGSVEKGTFEITWTVVPGEVEGGEGEGEGSDTPAVDPTKLNGKWEASFFSTYFWYLTFENGTLVINDTTNGITGADLSGTYTYTVVEGLPVLNNNTTITFIKDAGGNMIMVVNGKTNLAMTKTENGAAEEEIIPSATLGENSVSVPADKAVTGTKVNFTSANGGTYVLTATDANSWISLDGGYNWLQAGEKKEFTLAAGQTISILVGAYNEAADTIEFSITEKTGEDEEKPAGPIDIWGVDQLPELGGSLDKNSTQQFKFWGPLPNGTLTINGRDMWVMYNNVRYNPSRNGVVSIPVKETDVNEEGYVLIEICSGPVAVTYTFGFSYAPGTGENPEKLNDLHKVELNLDADGHWYQFTATETGNLVIYLNQGLEGSIVDILLENKNNEDWNTNSASLVTYDDDLKPIVGKSVTLAVNEGDTILIYVYELADEPKGGNVIFSNREALVADGSQKDPFTMEVGKTYDFIVSGANAENGLYYVFTATENGTLIITATGWNENLGMTITGATNKYNGTYTAKVVAGQTYTLNVWSNRKTDMDLDLVVSFEKEQPKPGATLDTAIDLDETKTDLTLSFTGSAGTYFVWTATANGTVTIALDKNEWLQGTGITVNGTAMSAYGMRTVTVEVKAGDVIVIIAKDMQDGDDTIDLDVTFAEAPKVDPAVENVIKLIEAIGEVTLDSEAAIKAAREAMDALDMNQKMEVTNSMTLADAEAKLLQLKQEAAQAAADKAEAEKVMALIDKIGTVTANSKADIEAARAAYEALTDAQKALVTNLETLERAEKAFEGIKPEGDNTVIFFAMMAMAATGLVVLVSKKRAF